VVVVSMGFCKGVVDREVVLDPITLGDELLCVLLYSCRIAVARLEMNSSISINSSSSSSSS